MLADMLKLSEGNGPERLLLYTENMVRKGMLNMVGGIEPERECNLELIL